MRAWLRKVVGYTTFTIGNRALDKKAISPDEAVRVTVDVRNTGTRRGDEVVPLYIHQRYGSVARPVRELKGFERVTLDKGQSRTVTFTLGPEERRYWSAARKDWVNEPSTFDVFVGSDSTISVTTTVEVSPNTARRASN